MNSGRGETSLKRLLQNMNPVLHGGEYVFCTLPRDADVPRAAIAVFREEESTTIVIERDDAEAHRLDPLYRAAWITLAVYSDMNAVGFLAAITNALAAEQISCNVFSAVNHDHLFVPYDQGPRALEILHGLSR